MAVNSDSTAAQIFGLLNVRIGTHHHAAVIEPSVKENRNRRDRRAAAFKSEVLCDLQLANIEFVICEEPLVAFPRRQRNRREIQTRGRYLAIDERPCPIVIAARKRKPKIGHGTVAISSE